jgi:hypothetical protein
MPAGKLMGLPSGGDRQANDARRLASGDRVWLTYTWRIPSQPAAELGWPGLTENGWALAVFSRPGSLFSSLV